MININIFINCFLSILIIISCKSSFVYSKPVKEQKKIISSTDLSIGVKHTNEIIYNYLNQELNHQNINYIEMDLSLINNSYSLKCHKSKNITNGKETLHNQVVNEQINGKNIIGAINGDFFNISSGIPTCTNLSNGEIFSTSLNENEEMLRPCFAVLEDNLVDINYYGFNGKINFIDKKNFEYEIKIDSLNRNDYIENTINLFNFKNNEHSTIFLPKEREDALIILIKPDNLNPSFMNEKKIKGKILNIINDPENAYKLSKDEIALVAYDEKKDLFTNITKNMDIEINLSIKKKNNPHSIKVDQLLTGHEFIIYDEEIPDENYFSKTWNKSSVYSKNHRTALALTKRNTLIILTIDKNKDFKGMSLPDLGIYLKSLDSYTAINLDGGGSTSMMIRELGMHSLKNINLPRENRFISNSIMISNTLPYTTDIKDFYFHDSPQINRNESRRLNFIAYDINLNPIDVYLLPNLKLSSNVGTFDSNGTFYPFQACCKGTISIDINKISKTYPIEIT